MKWPALGCCTFYEKNTKLYFDANHLTADLNKSGWNLRCTFFHTKCPFSLVWDQWEQWGLKELIEY